MKPLLLVLLAYSSHMMGTTQAFAPLPYHQPLSTRPSSAVPLPTTTPATTTSLAFSMTPLEEVLSDSDLMEEEFSNSMTHVLLDFTSLWGTAARVRLASVLGRLFVIGEDFRHGEVLPDEMAVQLGLLAVSCHGLHKTLAPKFKAQFLTPTLLTGKDRQAYRSIFRPSGLSWLDFKQLHSECMDWVQVDPGHVLLQDNNQEGKEDPFVYWLYQGDVQVWSNDTLTHNLSGRQEVAGLGLLGEGRLTKLLESPRKRASKAPPKTTNGLKAVAGESGATLLRINANKLAKLLRHDNELTHAVHRLAFMGMQDKLDALLLANNKEAATP